MKKPRNDGRGAVSGVLVSEGPARAPSARFQRRHANGMPGPGLGSTAPSWPASRIEEPARDLDDALEIWLPLTTCSLSNRPSPDMFFGRARIAARGYIRPVFWLSICNRRCPLLDLGAALSRAQIRRR